MNSKKVLLVEDNQSDIELTRRAFGKAGFDGELVVVEDGQEALDFLAGCAAEDLPTLTLIDLNLPKVPGLEVLRRIRADVRTRRMPLVVLSTSKEEQDVAASYDTGANSYIRKPVDYGQFREYIAQLDCYWLTMNEPPPPPSGTSGPAPILP